MNVFIASGRLATEPELKTNKRGKLFCAFRFAIYGDFRGENYDRDVDFMPCVCFGKKGQDMYQRLGKGMQIEFVGKLRSFDTVNRHNEAAVRYCIVIQKYEVVNWNRSKNPVKLHDGDGKPLIPSSLVDGFSKLVDRLDEDLPEDFVAERSTDDLL